MMNIQFKNIFKNIGFLQNLSSYIVPIILAVIAGGLFIPTTILRGGLKEDLEKTSLSKANKIKSLNNDIIPINQWQIEKDYQDTLASDANKISLLAIQSTQRELLSYKIFPEPNESSILIFKGFGEKYRDKIEGMMKKFGAGLPPSEKELETNLQGIGLASSGRTRSIANRSHSKTDAIEKTIIDELCIATAKNASFYGNPLDISGFLFWGSENQEVDQSIKIYEYVSIQQSVTDCWYWQLAYWIIEDILNTIGAMNQGYENILDSPVKRLVTIIFEPDPSSYKEHLDKTPRYVLPDEGKLTYPLTKRYTDDSWDIVHFNFSVLLSSKSVLPFMKELCSLKDHKFEGYYGEEPMKTFKHNQITILESDIESVVTDEKEHELYRYGEDAVVKLNLICEYIFNKEGYEKIKPEWVKEELDEQD